MPDKETKRDRRDEAKKARLEAQRKMQRAKAMRKVYGGVAAVVVIALIGFAISNSGKAGKAAAKTLATAAKAAGCGEIQSFAELARTHLTPPNPSDLSAVDPQTADTIYNSNPPTSGPHYSLGGAPSQTGVHLNPIPNGAQVHNLEHGHVGIQYTSAVPEAVRTALEEVASKNNTWVFSAPREGMPQQLAFTAWQHMLTCASPTDATAIAAVAEAFRKAYQDKAPESIQGAPQ